MPFYATLPWLSVSGLMTCGAVVWTWAMIQTTRYPRGTYERFVWRSVEHVTQWCAVVTCVMNIVTGTAIGSRALVAVFTVFLLLEVLIIWAFYRDDDDDWFKKNGRRLRDRMHSWIESRTPMPRGAGA